MAEVLDISKRKNSLRNLIPKTRAGDPKTDRLEQLDSMLYSMIMNSQDLDFIEKEIRSAIDFFAKRKMRGEELEDEIKD